MGTVRATPSKEAATDQRSSTSVAPSTSSDNSIVTAAELSPETLSDYTVTITKSW
jgi:hypothetical protein